jgi:hypothetical protein
MILSIKNRLISLRMPPFWLDGPWLPLTYPPIKQASSKQAATLFQPIKQVTSKQALPNLASKPSGGWNACLLACSQVWLPGAVCGGQVLYWNREEEKVVVLRELQRAIIYTRELNKQAIKGHVSTAFTVYSVNLRCQADISSSQLPADELPE